MKELKVTAKTIAVAVRFHFAKDCRIFNKNSSYFKL